jgi:hypothetical protein
MVQGDAALVKEIFPDADVKEKLPKEGSIIGEYPSERCYVRTQ